MKILHIALTFFPDYLGSSVRLYNLLSNLPYNIRLYVPDRTLKGENIQKKEEQFANINVKRVSLGPYKGRLDRVYNLNRRIKILVTSAQRDDFDVIHGHASRLEFGLASKELAKKSKKPFIYEVHGINAVYSMKFNPMTILAYTYVRKKEMNIIKSTNHIITLTQPMKHWLSNFYKIPNDRITVVPNGLDINKFSSKKHKKGAIEVKEKLGISGKIIMYAGYLNKVNGIGDLAKVIPDIIRERSNISFVFMGNGLEEERVIALSKKYPKNVKLLEVVPHDQMPIYYQMCDVFIIPRPSTISAETVTPLKLLEAMAMEKPVLGSNVGGIAEVIKHGENGYLFEKGNLNSFKKTLLEVLGTDNTQIGKNARRTAVENYTWDKSAKILQKIYEGLV